MIYPCGSPPTLNLLRFRRGLLAYSEPHFLSYQYSYQVNELSVIVESGRSQLDLLGLVHFN